MEVLQKEDITVFHANCIEFSAFQIEAIAIFFLIDLIDGLESLCFLYPHFSQ